MKARWLMSIVVIVATLVCARLLPAAVVVSQLYGGGGNTGATFTNDFIELFNGGATTVDLTGWSVQYNSAAGTGTWQTTSLSGTIPAGSFFLIQEGAGSGGTTALPTPDATGSIDLSNTAGKVVLVSNATALVGDCPSGAQIVDLVGYGTVTCFEGPGPAPAPSNSLAALRTNPCYDTDNNAADFAAGTPDPRNSATPVVPCTPPPPIDYAVLQFPEMATSSACQSVGATTIYGRLYIAGVTGLGMSEPPGIVAEVGAGPTGSDPAVNAGWTWARAAFNVACSGCGNNAEYQAPIVSAHASGTYDYAYRFSYLGGSFVYADLDGNINGTANGYSAAEAGQLTVSGDVIYCDRFDR